MFLFPVAKNPKSHLQSRLFILAGLCLFLLSAILTLSRVVKYRSWDVNLQLSHWAAFIIWSIGACLIHHTTIKRFENWDAIILPTAFLLVGWGMITVWRLSFVFGVRQSIWYMVSVALIYTFFNIDGILDILRKYKYFLLLLGLLLAILTFFFGTYPGGEGPNLWLGFHGIYFQPSELLKIILIVYLAAYFSEKYFLKFNLLETILPTLILVIAALFILVGQRDMGTALIFIVIYIGMLYIAFGKKRILLIGALIIAIAAFAGYFFVDLIRIRFQAWIEPWLEPQTGSYQIIQSLIAIAAGGAFGSGFGIGYPSLVPISHSDFIYSSIVEETGLAGSIGLICLFTILLYRGIYTALKTGNKFHRFLATGITIFLIFQTILIIGGNIRLLPITGVTLPFVSYGGSSLITSMLAIAFMVKISDCKAELHRDLDKLSPFRNGAVIFSTGLVLLALITGWWAVIRSNDLQLRQDNNRNLIAAHYVKRGSILDSNSEKLTETDGTVGDYAHSILYAPLSNTIGYYDFTYGISGLEEVYNDYLSGQKGYSAFDTWFNYLLYDQPLPGRDVKLTLDLHIQESLDNVLKGHIGSAVVMDASTGGILAISSYPYFDANSLGTNWDTWYYDERSPFLNRATQGAYPLGELLTPFLIADNESVLTGDITAASVYNDGCAVGEQKPQYWSQAVSNGCIKGLRLAASEKSGADILNSITNFGLKTSIDIGLPIYSSQLISQSDGWYELLYGTNRLRVSPLQVAYAFSIFSNQGNQATPHILSAVNTQQEGWEVMGKSEEFSIISSETAQNISLLLDSDETSGWEISTHSQDVSGHYTWYVAGTPANWNGTPLVLVIVIEEDNAEYLRSIGQQIYRAITES